MRGFNGKNGGLNIRNEIRNLRYFLKGENGMNEYMENKIIGIVELNSELNKNTKERKSFGKGVGSRKWKKVFENIFEIEL